VKATIKLKLNQDNDKEEGKADSESDPGEPGGSRALQRKKEV
jgi:hypothetical protein